MELNKFNWKFYKTVEFDEAFASKMLIENEKWVIAYKTRNDKVVFTNKRIIFVDTEKLGMMRSKKTEFYSLPYKSIDMFSLENAGGLFDLTAELEIWSKVGHLKLEFTCDFNLELINKTFSAEMLK